MAFADLIAVTDRAVVKQAGDGPITYTPGVGDPVTVDGVFDSSFVLVGTDIGEAGVASEGPGVFLLMTDLPSDPEIDTAATVTVAGVTYLPHTVKKDGVGGVMLLMHLV